MLSTSPAAQVLGRLPRIMEPALVSPAAFSALETTRPLTILRAARGFGKTTTLVSWLRQRRDSIRTVYQPLGTWANDVHGFWHGLAEALHALGVIPPVEPSDPRTHLKESLTALAAPLRLILDNYHEAGLSGGADAIDEDLIDLVRTDDNFYLVVAGRTARALESVGPLSVDASVIGPPALRLDADGVRELAQAAGLDLAAEQAERVAADLGGWPAAIRACLREFANRGHLDEDRVMGYVSALVADLRFGDVRDFLLRTAVPEDFDIDLLRLVMPAAGPAGEAAAPDPARILARLRGAGLVHDRRTTAGVRYSYPPAIRRALLHVMHQTAPDIGRQVHRALLAGPAGGYQPGEALTHAVRAEEWATALELIDEQWFSLLTKRPGALVDAVRRIPAAHGDHDPRVRMAREHLAAIVDRTRGGAAWVVPETLLRSADVMNEGAGAVEPADEDSLVLLQWGVAALLSGNHDAATYAFSHARELGLGRHTLAAVLGAAGLTLVHALAGEPDLARESRTDATLQQHLSKGGPVDPGDLAAVTVRIADALAAVDAGDADAGDRVAAMVEPRNRAELWIVAEFVRAHHATVADDPEEVFRQANQVRAALRHIPRGTLADTVLRSVLVELLLIARMVGVAAEVAAELGEDPIGWTAMAKVFHARQDYQAAIDHARRAAQAPDVSRRSQLEATVILASALHARNARAQARAAFHQAMLLSSATGQRRPFQLMPRYVFDMLTRETPQVAALWPSSGPAQGGTREAVELPTLTMREAQVLRALERHSGPVGIGQALGLSVNTVKTHLRSIYRKLGVASRNEALAAAGRGYTHTSPGV